MKLEAESISFAISIGFCFSGIIDYLGSGEPYPPVWIISFIALLVTVGIKVIERELDNLESEGLKKELDELNEILKDKGH